MQNPVGLRIFIKGKGADWARWFTRPSVAKLFFLFYIHFKRGRKYFNPINLNYRALEIHMDT